MANRNYRKEYDNYQGKASQIKRRSSRNKARRLAIKRKGKAAVAGKDIDHKDGNPMNNGASNLRVQSKSKNRSRNKQ
jgi:hypothetical protein